jgi:hypothetical protein
MFIAQLTHSAVINASTASGKPATDLGNFAHCGFTIRVGSFSAESRLGRTIDFAALESETSVVERTSHPFDGHE